MRFEQIIPLYDDQPIAKRFATQDTRFEVTEGNIHAIISETELVELLNSGKTMYSGMNDIKIDITGLRASISSLATAVDANTGNITSLDSRVATYSATLDGVSADLESTKSNLTQTNSQVAQLQLSQDTFSTQLSNVTTNLSSNYYTKTQVDDKADEAESNAISAAASDATTKASNAQANAISAAASDATTKANQALASANSATDLKLQNYSTTEAVTSAINQKADAITLEVSETYSTKAEAQGYASTAQTNAISAAASDATTKANNAIATAAADATTKANNAKASADASTDLKLQSYSTTTQMNSAIAQSASNITSTVSETYATKVEARNYVDNTLESYSTTTQMNSAITQRANSIMATVSDTYATKTQSLIDAGDAYHNANTYTNELVASKEASITATTNAISLKVTNNTANITTNTNSITTINSTLSSMSARIDVYDNSIVARVAANGLISSINQSSETIKINASKVNITGDTMISAINGATGTVKINASKINLSGYVTISALSTAGSTTINGSNITTGSINARRITTGILGNTSGNYWNLEQGNFVLKGTGALGLHNAVVMQDGELSISATYIDTGTMSADRILGGTLKLGVVNNTSGVLELYKPVTVNDTQVSRKYFRLSGYGLWIGPNLSSASTTTEYNNASKFRVNNSGEVFAKSFNVTVGGINNSSNSEVAMNDDGVKISGSTVLELSNRTWYNWDPSSWDDEEIDPYYPMHPYVCINARKTSVISGSGEYSYLKGSWTALSTYGLFCDYWPNGASYNGAYSAQYTRTGFNLAKDELNINTLSNTASWCYADSRSQKFAVDGTKNRIVNTKDYGRRFLYCYETPTPYFGDIGDGVVGEDGLCYINIDPIFAETIVPNQYQVFLQKYGEGDCWVQERKESYFIVSGTANLSFGWEIKAKQIDYDQYRIDKEWPIREERNDDYVEEAIQHINEVSIDWIQEVNEHIDNIAQERNGISA